MTFLPIVARELRVAARRRGTYVTRFVIAVGALVLGGFIFLMEMDARPQLLGQFLFRGLSVLALFYCLATGRRSTADCLSEEKREGTLGLLFLTDLRGYDIVFGKLAATSLNGFYGLLAVFPVLAIPLLMGGVTNGEFWRMVLVLVNTFLLSLAIGIFVSALSRDFRKAMGGNFLLLFLLTWGGPACAGLIAFFSPSHHVVRELVIVSPCYSFVFGYDVLYKVHARDFWLSSAIVFGLTCLLVLLAAWIVPHSWQDRPARAGKSRWRNFWQAWSFGGAAKRPAYRKQLLDINAFYWLAARARLKPLHVWVFFAFLGCWWLGGWLASRDYWLDDSVKITTAIILNITLKSWITVETSQRLAEDQKSGALELLLSSPLTVRDILRGQFLALRRQFLAPMLAAIALELFFILTVYQNSTSMAFFLGAGIFMLVADVTTLIGVAMATALTARSPNQAATSTFVRVLILPCVIFGIIAGLLHTVGSALTLPGWAGSDAVWKYYLPLWCATGILIDLAFGIPAWMRLKYHFRRLATERFDARKASPLSSPSQS
jgi:ABC-type transport system involved in multi-copper enzyme maturation permease subunit